MDFLQQIFKENDDRRKAIIEKWQKDKRRKIPNKDKILFCSGCRQNFYNGNNEYGIEKCWSLDEAKLKKRTLYLRVDSNETEEIITLSCYVRKYR